MKHCNQTRLLAVWWRPHMRWRIYPLHALHQIFVGLLECPWGKTSSETTKCTWGNPAVTSPSMLGSARRHVAAMHRNRWHHQSRAVSCSWCVNERQTHEIHRLLQRQTNARPQTNKLHHVPIHDHLAYANPTPTLRRPYAKLTLPSPLATSASITYRKQTANMCKLIKWCNGTLLINVFTSRSPRWNCAATSETIY